MFDCRGTTCGNVLRKSSEHSSHCDLNDFYSLWRMKHLVPSQLDNRNSFHLCWQVISEPLTNCPECCCEAEPAGRHTSPPLYIPHIHLTSHYRALHGQAPVCESLHPSTTSRSHRFCEDPSVSSGLCLMWTYLLLVLWCVSFDVFCV